MKVEQIYTGCLAEAAYYIESDGEAVIIDPLRETQPYMEKLEKEGATLKYIFETHFHADFVSGHLDLAKKTGAAIVYGPGAATEFDKHEAQDGEELKVGRLTFKILHTPGHTPESTTFLLKDENGKDYAIFTGDTLFIGDVGRPDLAQKAGSVTKEDLAGWLYDSLRNKIMTLADDVIVYPAHGAGSACGKNMSSDTWDTLGHQKETNYALRADMTKDEFIAEVTAGLAPPPQYFAKNAMLNKKGYGSFDAVLKRGAVPLSPAEIELLQFTPLLVPQADHTVATAGHQLAPIGVQRDTGNSARMAADRDLLARPGMDQMNIAAGGDRRHRTVSTDRSQVRRRQGPRSLSAPAVERRSGRW